MIKQVFNLTGNILDISEIKTYERDNKIPLKKRILTLETDCKQKVFMEVRYPNFSLCEYLNKGNKIKVDYVFSGSEKNGVQYNNIVVLNIELI